MGSVRLVVAIVLLAAGAAAAGVAYAALDRASGATGVYGIDIVGPGHASVYSGELRVENATALGVLLAAAAAGGFDVTLDEYPGLGPYVRAIAGHEAHGASGWVYEIWRDGAWLHGDRSAAHKPLEEGDALRWRWTDEGA